MQSLSEDLVFLETTVTVSHTSPVSQCQQKQQQPRKSIRKQQRSVQAVVPSLGQQLLFLVAVSSLVALLHLSDKTLRIVTFPVSVGAYSILPITKSTNAFAAYESKQQRQQQPQQRASSLSISYFALRQSSATTTTTTSDIIQSNNNNNEIALNPMVSTIQPSKTVELFSMVKQMESAQPDIKIVSLCVGEPDYLPPPNVIETMMSYIQQQPPSLSSSFSTTTSTDDNQKKISEATKYTAVTGLVALRQAIAHDIQQRKQVTYNPLSQIIVSNGAKQCIYQALWSIIDGSTKDVVLIPAPYWPSYTEQVRLLGGIPHTISTTIDDGYKLTPQLLRSTIEEHYNNRANNEQQEQQQIKALILCNPCNPTGVVYSGEELQQLCTVLYDYPNIVVIADEIYERLLYSNSPSHISIAAIPNMYHRTILINGFSKSHAMTGLRIGYVCTPNIAIGKAISTIQSQLTSCANAMGQYAAISAIYDTPETWFTETVLPIMEQKRDYVVQQLRRIPNIIMKEESYIPCGAFYVLVDVRAYCSTIPDPTTTATTTIPEGVIYDDTTFCIDLLQEQQLAVVPGSAFGCDGTIRISYATSMEQLILAMDKLYNYCISYNEKERQ